MSANWRSNMIYKLKKKKNSTVSQLKIWLDAQLPPHPSIKKGGRACTLCFMCLTVEIPNEMTGEEAPSKLFNFHKQWGFFLVYSLITKYSSFLVKLKNASMYGTVRTVCCRKYGFLSYFYIRNSKNIRKISALQRYMFFEVPNLFLKTYILKQSYTISFFRQLLK